MSLEANIVSILDAVLPGKVHPVVAPADALAPYCVYSLVGGTERGTLTEARGLATERVQVVVYSPRMWEASDLMSTIVQSIGDESVGFRATAVFDHVSTYDRAEGVYGIGKDFRLHEL